MYFICIYSVCSFQNLRFVTKPWETGACTPSTRHWKETFRNGANHVWAFLSFLLCDKNGQIAFDFAFSPLQSPTSHLQLDITNRATLLSHNTEQDFVLHTFQCTIWKQAYTVHKLSDYISTFNITVQTPGVCLLFQCAWYSLSTLSDVTCSHFRLGQRHQEWSHISPAASSWTHYCVNVYETVTIYIVLLAVEPLMTVKEAGGTIIFCHKKYFYWLYFENAL